MKQPPPVEINSQSFSENLILAPNTVFHSDNIYSTLGYYGRLFRYHATTQTLLARNQYSVDI